MKMYTDERLQEWREIRAKVLSTKQSVRALKALKILEGDQGSSMYEVWQDLKGVGYQSVVKALKRLEKDAIVYSEEASRGQVKRREFSWTVQGVLMLPELVPVEGTLVGGGLASLMQSFFGKYEEVVNYISETIAIDSETSETLFLFFLKHTVTFLTWIREYVFRITGIQDPDDHEFFQEKMLTFTFELLLLPSLVEENLRDLGKDGYLHVISKLWENRVTQVRDIIQSIETDAPAQSENQNPAKPDYDEQLYV